jgi:hypothetical protein
LGLASHSGLAFWHRLTVHPEPNIIVQQESSQTQASPGQVAGPGLWARAVRALLLKWLDKGRPGDSVLWAVAGHAVPCTLPIACLAVLALRLLGRPLPGLRGRGSQALRLQRRLLAAAYCSVAAYHCLEQLVQQGALPKDATAGQLLQLACAVRWGPGGQWGAAQQTWDTLSAAVQAVRAQLLPGHGLLSSLAGGSWQRLLGASLRLLLPQLTYSLCGASLLAWTAQQVQRRVQRYAASHATAALPCPHASSNVCSGGGSSSGDQVPVSSGSSSGGVAVGSEKLAVIAAGAVGLQAPLLAALLQVSDAGTPLVLLLGAAQLWAVTQLLRIRCRQLGSSAAAGIEGAAVLAVVQAQMFFSTGHLCEFAGLQYLAGRHSSGSLNDDHCQWALFFIYVIRPAMGWQA